MEPALSFVEAQGLPYLDGSVLLYAAPNLLRWVDHQGNGEPFDSSRLVPPSIRPGTGGSPTDLPQCRSAPILGCVTPFEIGDTASAVRVPSPRGPAHPGFFLRGLLLARWDPESSLFLNWRMDGGWMTAAHKANPHSSPV